MDLVSIRDSILSVEHLLRRKHREGRKFTVNRSNELDFLRDICILIPYDFIFSTKLFWVPEVRCDGKSDSEYFDDRCRDIIAMCERVSLWFARHLPPRNADNAADIDALLLLRDSFAALEAVGRNFLLKNPYAVTDNDSDSCDCGRCDCYCINYGPNRCDCCFCCQCRCSDCPADFCVHTCHSCSRGILSGNHSSVRYIAESSQNAASEGRNAILGFFEKDVAKHATSANEMCRSWCSDVCGNHASNACCCNQVQDAARIVSSGGSWCGDMCRCIGSCSSQFGSICFDILHGVGKLIGQLLQIFNPENICNTIEFCSRCVGFGRDCSCLNAMQNVNCSNCNCGDCKCDCNCDGDALGAIGTMIGVACGIVGSVYDAVVGFDNSSDSSDGSPTNNSTDFFNVSYFDQVVEIYDESSVESFHRRLSQTSPQYTPSIIFMCIAIFVFAPRIVFNFSYIFVNWRQGISKDRNLKVLAAMFLLAIPSAILLCAYAEASTWTFVTISCMFTHFAYRVESMRHKRFCWQLADTSYLSAVTWRSLDATKCNQTDVLELVCADLLKHKEIMQSDMIQMSRESFIHRIVYFTCRSVFKLLSRIRLSRDIISSHQLIASQKAQRYVGPTTPAQLEPVLAQAVILPVESVIPIAPAAI
jgi:hypothetical protein